MQDEPGKPETPLPEPVLKPASGTPDFKLPPFTLPDFRKIPPQRIIFLIVLIGILIYLQFPTGPTEFKPSADGVQQELAGVIGTQLTAIRSNDWQRAFTFAAAPLQQKYHTVPAFEQMVRQAYPLIATSKSARFGAAMDNGHEAMIHVTVFDKDGRVARYQYLLIREGRAWKINGVNLAPPAGPAG